ncbi:C2 domain-containing protein 2 [Microcaecilia unicolor]|uniref:C2 domain-containing protein 2 n=1 Tax=Microcaecilia unicolor TaxID=1415580 RepID=A0A6P7YA13_9AMPH|nr:C2 domain-containing protein 2 [Microcaecilia unicolor]
MAWLHYWLSEIGWFVLVSLFIAALVTLVVYLLQYVLGTLQRHLGAPPLSDLQDTDSLLAWVLSLKSWRSQWIRAWISALNTEANKSGHSPRLSFEDDGSKEPLELSVQQIMSVVKSSEEKVVSCNVLGQCMRFSITVASATPAASQQTYNVCVSPLHLQLELHVKEGGEDIQVMWSFINIPNVNLEIQPKPGQEIAGTREVEPTLRDTVQALLSSVHPSVALSTKPTSVKNVQNMQSIGTTTRGMSPPKPPRIHELRLQVKNITTKLPASQDTSGSISPLCVAQLNEPVQKFITTAAKNPLTPSWEEEFSFELNAKSRELTLHIVEAGNISENMFLACATVPIDLFRKQPSGQQSFALSSNSGTSPGSLTAEFSFVEPSDLRLRQISTPLPARKVEMDRTVMPCGTVVTTVTAVKSKPRSNGKVSLGSDSPRATPTKVKAMERNFSMQAMLPHGAPVSKTLSSSDTELLMLNGADPVAEAAIRQLRESAKQTPKSPRKKSTIIISGVSKAVLCHQDEASIMMNYTAAMDSTTSNETWHAHKDPAVNAPTEVRLPLAPSNTLPVLASGEGLVADQHKFFKEWDHSQQDQTYDEMCGSNQSVSEVGTMKKSKGGFLRKSAKLFFRRRHQQKEPGMSQSHNDLIFLQQQPGTEEQRQKGATLTRFINKKLLPRNRSKGGLASALAEQKA